MKISKACFATFMLNCLLFNPIMAQTISGVYSLQGIREMASAFEFTEDGKFRFFYSYGAVDRFAEGTFSVDQNKIVLKSSKIGGNDFEILSQSTKSSKYRISVSAPNTYLLADILVVGIQGDLKFNYYTDEEGNVELNELNLDQILMQHPLYPDEPSIIKDSSNSNTYFEVALKPSLEQVSFKSIDLEIVGNELHCLPNYFMPFANIRFVKED